MLTKKKTSTQSLLKGNDGQLSSRNSRQQLPKFINSANEPIERQVQVKPPGPRPNTSSLEPINRPDTVTSGGSKQKQFFEKHKGNLSKEVQQTVAQREKRESSKNRGSSRDRLYGHETISTLMKKNPELFDYDGKLKKPPPPRKVVKRQKTPAPPEPPKVIPPDEPLSHSPHRLGVPYEPTVPFEDATPHVKPLPMRRPEDPPHEPTAHIVAGIFEPVEPLVPIWDDIFPR